MTDTIPKSLEEVWKLKDEVYNDTKDMTFEKRKEYGDYNLKKTAELIDAELIKNNNGTFKFVSK